MIRTWKGLTDSNGEIFCACLLVILETISYQDLESKNVTQQTHP